MQATEGSDLLLVLEKLADETVLIGQQIERLEEEKKEREQRLNQIKSVDIPEIMDEAGIKSIHIGDRTYNIATFVSGSWPKDPIKAQKARELLAEYGAEGLMKSNVTANFPKSMMSSAMKVAKAAKDMGGSAKVSQSVHHQTLKSFAKERMASGDPIDLEGLGLYAGRIVRISGEKR